MPTVHDMYWGCQTSIPAKILQSSKMVLVRAFLQPEKINTKQNQLKKKPTIACLNLEYSFLEAKTGQSKS